jgi:hypothetical protein
MVKKIMCLLIIISSYQCHGISDTKAHISKTCVGTILGLQSLGLMMYSDYDKIVTTIGCLSHVGIYWLASRIINSYTPSYRLMKTLTYIKQIAHTYPVIAQDCPEELVAIEDYHTYISELTLNKHIDESKLDSTSFIKYIQDSYSLIDTPIYQAFLDRKNMSLEINYHINEA